MLNLKKIVNFKIGFFILLIILLAFASWYIYQNYISEKNNISIIVQDTVKNNNDLKYEFNYKWADMNFKSKWENGVMYYKIELRDDFYKKMIKSINDYDANTYYIQFILEDKEGYSIENIRIKLSEFTKSDFLKKLEYKSQLKITQKLYSSLKEVGMISNFLFDK